MTRQILGRLEKVELREIWSGEATKFTPWLAEKENLALLGDTLGMELVLEAQEKDVGPYSADIFCKNTADDSWVVIENQLERTDHSHLGQILTYAAGLSAVSVVWIAQRFTDEHRAALDWLNEISGESAQFFGLEIELWQIGKSLPAPKFNIVAKPNDWTRSEKSRAQGLTPNKQLQLDFWLGFREYLLDRETPLKPSNPRPQHYMDIGLGRSGFWLAAIASLWDSAGGGYSSQELRAELSTNHYYAEYYYSHLVSRKSEIEDKLGCKVTWHNPGEGVRVRKIYVQMSTSLQDKNVRSEQYEWLARNLEKLREIFEKYLQHVQDPSEGIETELESV